MLKFNLDMMTEYKDIDEVNSLIDRETEMIENIKQIDSSIYSLASYNVLHETFYL